MDKKQVVIRVDDRVRLMSAVLAATSYPDKSQERRKHGTHPHARGTRKVVGEYTHHPAVHALQVLLDQNVSLVRAYKYALRLTWPGLEALETDDELPRWVPPGWSKSLRHFYEVTGLAKWWSEEKIQWSTAQRHLEEAFAKTDLYAFLEPFVGPVMETLVFMPNIGYPTDQRLGLRLGGELVAIMPPPIAWGDSPPWPYKDDPALAYRTALHEYGEILMSAYLGHYQEVINNLADKSLYVDERYAAAHLTWKEQFMGLFKAAITAIFLEDSVSSLEARSFLQFMQKVENLTVLPGVVSVFRRYLEEYKAGRYPTFAEYLPNFPKHLRVVKSIAAI